MLVTLTPGSLLFPEPVSTEMRPRLRRGSWVYRTEVVTQGNDFVTKRGDSIGSLKNLHGILRRRPLFPRSLIRPTLRDRGSSSRRGRGRENR